MAVLEIVFVGLVSFAESQAGGHALILNGEGACKRLCGEEQCLEHACSKYKHKLSVYLLYGCLDKECKKPIPKPLNLPHAKEPYVFQIAGLKEEPWHEDPTPLPDQSPGWSYPRSKKAGAGFAWVASAMEASGKGRSVHPNCFEASPKFPCPLSARFDLPYGEARACHAYHCDSADKASADCTKKGQKVFGFTFEDPLSRRSMLVRRAMADAALVENAFSGEYITFEIKYGEKDKKIKIYPQEVVQGDKKILKIVVFIANRSAHYGSDHFQLYYALSSMRRPLPPHRRAQPVYVGRWAEIAPVDHFECEDYINKYVEFDGGPPFAPPHNPQECVLNRYP